MPYMFCAHPLMRMDLMLLQQYWPRMASAFERTGCTYSKEDNVEIDHRHYVVLRDVKAVGGSELCRSRNIGELLGLFYALEWDSLMSLEPRSEDGPQKFYILIRPRRKGKKHVQKNREEAGAGRKGGNTGKPGDIQSGQDHGTGGGGDRPGGDFDGDAVQLTMFDTGTYFCDGQ